MTYDFERLMEGATKLGTSEFASAIIENMLAKSFELCVKADTAETDAGCGARCL